MASKVFDKLYSLILLLLPKLHMSILAGRDCEICPEKMKCLSVIAIICTSEKNSHIYFINK